METAHPPPLSQGLDLFPLPPPPPPRYLKVWIHHWLTHKNGDFGPKRSEAALRRSRICSVPHFGAMWTGIRTVAEVNKWEGELELAETEVNIQEWGLGLVHYTLFGQLLRFSSVLLLFLLYCIVRLLVSARKMTGLWMRSDANLWYLLTVGYWLSAKPM